MQPCSVRSEYQHTKHAQAVHTEASRTPDTSQLYIKHNLYNDTAHPLSGESTQKEEIAPQFDPTTKIEPRP